MKMITLGLISIFLVVSMSAKTRLKVSHQWATSDIRHKVAQIVADEVAKARVNLEIRIYPSKSLLKPKEQYHPLSQGRIDMIVIPLAYAAGRRPAYNLTLMPGLVKNHDHAARLVKSPFMVELEKIMALDNIMVLVHGYLAGGFGGKQKCITNPKDVKGLQIRAAGKSFEQMMTGAGASISSMPSSEIYSAMQTGILDAANTSSSSFISYRLYEQLSCYTPASEVALWFMYQPMLMNKSTFNSLNKQQRFALLSGAKKAQIYYFEEAKKADQASILKFREAGVKIAKMSEKDFEAWRAISKKSSYKIFVDETANGKKLLDMALSVK